MKDQLQTIRAALEGWANHGEWVWPESALEQAKRNNLEALAALAQLEAMVGEPAGWRYQHEETGRHMCHSNDGINTPEDFMKANPRWKLIGPMYATPVAQQYEAGDMASASAQGFRDGVASVTQQPPKLEDIEQYRMQMAGICAAAMGYWKEGDAIHPEYDTPALRDVLKLYAKYDELYKAQQPQAEAVPLLSDAEIVACRKAQVGRYGTVDPTKPYSDSIAFGRAVEAAVLAKRVPQWLPISTAPKGQRVMVWIADREAGENIAFAKVWFHADGTLGGGAEGFNGKWDLTHWMPLPPPPGIVGKEGA